MKKIFTLAIIAFLCSVSGVQAANLSSLNGLTTSAQTFVDDKNIRIYSSGSAHAILWTNQSLAVDRGGTGRKTLSLGQILFGDTSASISQSANLYWDKINSRLGIGNSSPDSLVDVTGSILASSSGNVDFTLRSGSDLSKFTIRTNSSFGGRLDIMNQSNILLSIASTGFVGIGTTLPAYKLDVNGNLQATEVVTNTISAKGTNQSVAINPTGTGKVVIGGESIVVARLTSEPASGSTGQIYFDRSIGRFKGYNGSTWMIFSEILPFVPTLLDNYSSANLDNGSTLNGSVKKVGQSFNAGAGGSLDSAEWYLQKTGSPTGSIYAKIYAHSGTYGSSSVPTGSPLAISDSYDISTIPTTDTTIRFNFSGVNRITLSGSTNYVVTIEYTGDSSNYVRVGADFSSPTHAGNYSESLDGSSWTAFSVDDNIFAVYASQ